MFKEIVQKSFQRVKGDVNALKQNMSEWIVFYNDKHNKAERRIEQLEQRIIFLERQLLQKR